MNHRRHFHPRGQRDGSTSLDTLFPSVHAVSQTGPSGINWFISAGEATRCTHGTRASDLGSVYTCGAKVASSTEARRSVDYVELMSAARHGERKKNKS